MGEKKTLQNSNLLLIDFQVDNICLVHSFSREEIKRNVIVLAKIAKILKIPVILTSLIAMHVKGTTFKELQEVIPEEYEACINRDGMIDCMDDPILKETVEVSERKNLIIAGITTDVSVAFSAMGAVQRGYGVQVVADACGSHTKLADAIAHRRMEAAGVTLTSTHQLIAELAQNWKSEEGKKASKILYSDILSKM